MRKRGQAVMEFLYSYGWAVLVLLAAISALAYFGIFNAEKFTPSTCTLEPGIGCIDYRVNENSVTLVLSNGMGGPISMRNISVGGCDGSASGELSDGEQSIFVIYGCSNTPGEKFRSDITILYSGRSGMMHYLTGEVIDEVTRGNSTCAWYGSWPFRRKITVGMDGTLTDFPMLVNIEDDAIFVPCGGSKLDHEIEVYDDTTVAWVRVPSLSNGTSFYMYYGNASQQNPSGVWDAGYKGVWHLDQVSDSAYNNHGTALGTVAGQGKISGALIFDGDDRVEKESPVGLNPPDALTVELWAKLNSYSCEAIVSLFRSSGDNRAWDLSHSCNGNGKPYLQVTEDGSSATKAYAIGTTTLATGTWYHIAGVFNSTHLAVYINGELDAGVNNPKAHNESMPAVTADFNIGAIDNPLNFFTGVLDEVRISDVARSGVWIKASFDNQNDPSSFYTVGVEEARE